MRVGRHPLLGGGDADGLKQLQREAAEFRPLRRHRLRPRDGPLAEIGVPVGERFNELLAHGAHRVHRAHRVLHDHPDVGAAKRRPVLRPDVGELTSEPADRAGRAGVGAGQSQNGACEHAFSRPGATARSTPWRTSVAPKATRRFRISRIGAGRAEGSDAAEESGAGTPPGIGGIVMRRKTSKGLGKEEMRTARVRGARTALSALPARSAGVRPGGGQRGYLKLSTSAERSSEP